MPSEVVQYVRPADRRLGRHVNHDPQSRRYARRAEAAVEVVTTLHVRHIPVFQQGNLGRCVPTSGLGLLGTGVFFAAYDAMENKPYPLTEEGCIQAYRDVTRIDPFPGEWEPDDTGSDGLSMAKLLKSKGAIPGFLHTFNIRDFVAGLMRTACMVGTVWTNDMFEHDADAVVHPTGSAAGGHEYIADGYIVKGDLFGPRQRPAPTDMVRFMNSWGPEWGDDGRHYIPVNEFSGLLARQGDATFLVPSDKPAPTPEPADPDQTLADELRDWARNEHAHTSKKARRAVRTWLDVKGL